MTPYYRWSDNDRRMGRFIYAREGRGGYRPISIELTTSGDEDERLFNTLRFMAFGRTLIVVLPQIIRPWKAWVDTSHYNWSDNPRGGYWDIGRREYGFSVSDGHLSVSLGRVTNDSSTEQRWGWFLPWTQWRHVRQSLYGLRGEHIADMPQWGGRPAKINWQVRHAEEDRVQALAPSATFTFADYDGEKLTAAVRIEEREWLRGTGWWRWLSLVWPKKVERYIDIRFSGETGRRKGSWKGGTVGHSGPAKPGELHEVAFRRYCAEHSMTFMGTGDSDGSPKGGDGEAGSVHDSAAIAQPPPQGPIS